MSGYDRTIVLGATCRGAIHAAKLMQRTCADTVARLKNQDGQYANEIRACAEAYAAIERVWQALLDRWPTPGGEPTGKQGR